MKTNIILGITAVTLLFSSCSKNETDKVGGQMLPNDPSRIGLGISTGSREPDFDLAGLEGKGTFNVVAVKNNNDSPVQLFNESYLFDGGRWDWTADPTDKTANLFNWPEAGADNYPMTFYSFFPMNYAEELDYKNGKAPDMDIAIYNTIGSQKDFIVAHTKVDAAPSNGRVNFFFKHILSRIIFKVQGSKAVKINILTLTINNVQDSYTHVDNPSTYNPITGWNNPITTAGTGTYMRPCIYREILDPFEAAVINSDDIEYISQLGRDHPRLMPQYGTPIWKTSEYLTASNEELKNPIYAKSGDGKFTQAALTQWNNNVLSKIKGSYFDLYYSIQDASDDSYIIGGANRFVHVGYPLDLTEDAEGKSWKTGKQYSYIISLGIPEATGGTLLDPFYIDEKGKPTTDPIDPEIVTPGNPINTGGKIGFNLKVGEWLDSPVTIK